MNGIMKIGGLSPGIMGIGPGLSMCRAGGGSWTPAQLFQDSEAGSWYDPSDLSTLYTDAAGTTAAVVNDPIGRMEDKSGNGNHATQSIAAYRPTLKSDGTYYWLEFDGVDDYMTMPAGVVDTSTDVILVNSIYVDAADISTVGYFLGTTTDDWGFVFLFYANPVRPRGGVVTSEGVIADTATEITGAQSYVYSQIWDRSAGNLILRQNQSDIIDVSGTPADLVSPTNYQLCRTPTNNRCLKNKLYGLTIISRELTTQELENTESFYAGKSGVTL